MAPADVDSAERCPVDPQTRERWLEAGRKQRTPSASPPSRTPSNPMQILHQHGFTRYSLDTSSWAPDFSNPRLVVQQRSPATLPTQSLPIDREVSSIPRALHTNHDRQDLNSAEQAVLPPANSEKDTGHDRTSGNWIYPSQEMFFAAMKRKGHSPEAADMATIVPIHNAVNERAWSEILTWERGRGSEKCGGPKLVSFSGDSKKLSPRARWNNAVMGYQKPFDRHDWVIDRCGKKVEYVIDFYSGKDEGLAGGKSLSFHLDVRPKINSWEGVSMRVAKSIWQFEGTEIASNA